MHNIIELGVLNRPISDSRYNSLVAFVALSSTA